MRSEATAFNHHSAARWTVALAERVLRAQAQGLVKVVCQKALASSPDLLDLLRECSIAAVDWDKLRRQAGHSPCAMAPMGCILYDARWSGGRLSGRSIGTRLLASLQPRFRGSDSARQRQSTPFQLATGVQHNQSGSNYSASHGSDGSLSMA